jgi:hypothetical protein
MLRIGSASLRKKSRGLLREGEHMKFALVDAEKSIRPANHVLDGALARAIARVEVIHGEGVEGSVGAPCRAVDEERAVQRGVRLGDVPIAVEIRSDGWVNHYAAFLC